MGESPASALAPPQVHASLDDAPSLEVRGLEEVADGDRLLVLAAAAYQVLAARHARIAAAPAYAVPSSRAHAARPLLLRVEQPPDEAVHLFLSRVASDFATAVRHAFYLDQKAEHLRAEVARDLEARGQMILMGGSSPSGDRSSGTAPRLWLSAEACTWRASIEVPAGCGSSPERIERLTRWLLHGMAWLARHPDAPLRNVSFLAPGEREQLRSRFAGPCRELPRGSLVDLLSYVARRYADRPAVRFGDSTLTHAELERRANQVAHLLVEAGLPASRRVGVLLPSSEALVPALLGILKCGSAYVPLDLEAPPLRRAALLRDVGVDLVLTTEPLAAVVAPQLPGVRLRAVEEATTRPSSPPGASVPGAAPAYVIFTSGTTGRPKGVEVTHRNLMNLCSWRAAAYELTEVDVTQSALPYYFDGFVSTLFPSLIAGACTVLAPDDRRRDVLHLREMLRQGVTNTALVPAIFEALFSICEVEDVPALRFVVVGGERLAPARLAAFRARFPAIELINEYGPTETTVTCMSNLELVAEEPSNIGRPIANTSIHVLDACLQPVPIDFPGELCVAGAGVSNGYIGQAVEGSGFIEHPDQPGQRSYRTGDLGLWRADGTVVLLGRVDNQLKIRGNRIELEEIEEAVTQHPDVFDAAVVPLTAHGRTTALCAFVVGRTRIDDRALGEHLAARLPLYMIPQQLIQIDELPITATGKKDRRALLDRVPGGAELEAPVDSTVAQAVRAAIASVLQLEGRIDERASFFQLGGDSIRGIMMQRILSRQLGTEIPILDILGAPTIRALIDVVARAARAAAGSRPKERFVRLRGGDLERSVFFVHDVSGEIAVYEALSAAMPERYTYWGIRAHDLVRLGPARLSIPQMARDYMQEMIARGKADTFSIAGWSMGGVLAFEIARQLERLGKGLSALVLMDPPDLPTGDGRIAFDVEAERAWIIHHMDSHPIRELARRATAGSVEELWEALAAGLEQMSFPEPALLAALPGDISTIISKYPQRGIRSILKHVNTVRSIVDAWERYGLQGIGVIGADLTFIRPSDSDAAPTRAWAGRTRGRFELSVVHGDHWSIFLKDNIAALAGAVGSALPRQPC